MKCNSTVENWTNSISSLPDNRFFEIMRLYLGEIETPYNKQRLIEQLAGFIKAEVNSDNMIALLDDYDLKILTALAFIPNATQETLVEFFAKEYTMAELFTELSNLISRLLIFEQKDEYSSRKLLRINPLIWGKLESLLTLSNIICPAETAKTNIDDCFCISPDFLAAFISFINTRGCSCKSDGTMKKNTLSRVQSTFAGQEKTIQLLLTAFINLNLIREGERSFIIDNERFALFAGLEQVQQYALLCAASCSRFSREGLKKEAQLLLDTLASIPEQGFTLASLIRLGFLSGTQSASNGGAGSSKSRFSRMLEAARQEEAGGTVFDPEQSGSILERMLDSAEQFGLLQKKGWDKEGREIFVCSHIMNDSDALVRTDNILNIDSTFTVSLMPGLPLKKLLPFTEFLEIKNYGVVTEYEITKQSVSAAFDRGWTVESLCGELEKYTKYELPQNLKVCISEWFDSYSSAILYKGYVLKVAKNNISFVENAPNIKKHIKEKLAEGIYLLNIPVETDISSFVEASGLDFMGKVKDSYVPGEKLAFPVLQRPQCNLGVPALRPLRQAQGPQGFSAAGHLLNSLKQELKNLDLTKNQRECLENRIRNRLILTKEQLAKTSVRSEILEAEGMDFGGKLHLFEAGLKENDMMELTLPQFDNENEYFKVIGHTLGITKQTGDAVVRFQVYPTNEITNFVVSRITYLRRLRF